ncbi:MAG: glycine C-acetyltransferase [Clostridiaceae bacterium]|nr:glycine C-acetyltransferase [Clostridiaceae bacterium]
MSGKALQKYLDKNLKDMKEQKIYNEISVFSCGNGPIIRHDGKELVNLSSTNYLALSNNPRIIEATIKATEKYGAGSGGTRALSGSLDIHEELEIKLAELVNMEAAITFQSAYNCNIGAIVAIMDSHDAILSDTYNHSSIIDGCIISGAKIIYYEHSSVKDLRHKAKSAVDSGLYNKIMVITDGIFSMDGDIAKIQDIVDIAEELDLITYVDDAHAIGVIGQNGSGSGTHHDLVGKIDLQIGTLSKAIGVVGGYVAGSKDLIEWLKRKSSPFLFSNSMTPGAVGAAIEAINILNESTELIDKLWHNGRYLKRELKKIGFDIGQSETPITPCIFSNAEIAQQFSQELLQEGVYAKILSFSTIPLAAARIRNIPTAAHDEEMLNRAIKAYKTVGINMGII